MGSMSFLISPPVTPFGDDDEDNAYDDGKDDGKEADDRDDGGEGDAVGAVSSVY